MSGICDTLKPCPICGGEPDVRYIDFVLSARRTDVRALITCSCGLEIMQKAHETGEHLRFIWNTRANEDTRWHELFGTPERAARTLADNWEKFCNGCPVDCKNHDCVDALLEWLRGDAE